MVSIFTRYSRCSRFASRPTHLRPSHGSSPFTIAFKNRQIYWCSWAPRYQSVYGRSRKVFCVQTDLRSGQLIPANPGSLSYSTSTKCWSKDKFLARAMDRTTTSNVLADILFIRVLRLTERAMVNHRPLTVPRSNPFNSIRFRDFFSQATLYLRNYFHTSICGCDSFKSAK
jgi:hypothetical protein